MAERGRCTEFQPLLIAEAKWLIVGAHSLDFAESSTIPVHFNLPTTCENKSRVTLRETRLQFVRESEQ